MMVRVPFLLLGRDLSSETTSKPARPSRSGFSFAVGEGAASALWWRRRASVRPSKPRAADPSPSQGTDKLAPSHDAIGRGFCVLPHSERREGEKSDERK